MANFREFLGKNTIINEHPVYPVSLHLLDKIHSISISHGDPIRIYGSRFVYVIDVTGTGSWREEKIDVACFYFIVRIL